MRIAGILKNSVVNGVGIRDVIFLQGCEHYCKNCHNPHTWSLTDGNEMDIISIVNEFAYSENNITISGGEPLLQFEVVMELIKCLKKYQPIKTIWLYTGFRYEEIPPHMLKQLALYVDVLVDGKFEEDKKDLTLQFRGSSNQRLINIKRSVRENKVKEWENGVYEEIV